jgi:uncharacterized protein YkwD
MHSCPPLGPKCAWSGPGDGRRTPSGSAEYRPIDAGAPAVRRSANRRNPPMPWLFSRGAKDTVEDRRVDYVSLRRPLVALFVAVSALGLGVSAYAGGTRTASPRPVKAEAQFVQELLLEINAVRAAHSVRPLRIGPALRRAADQHDREMGRRGYFDHDSPSGVSFSGRLARYYPSGRHYWSVGENLLWSGWSLTPKAAVRMWMQSPPHRANLLGREWRQIGIAALRLPSAPGCFGHRRVWLVTTDFGVRY